MKKLHLSLVGIILMVAGLIIFLKENLLLGSLLYYLGIFLGVAVLVKHSEFKHKDWDKNCNGELSTVFDNKYYKVCVRCGYDSRGKKFCNEVKFNQKHLDAKDSVSVPEVKDEN